MTPKASLARWPLLVGLVEVVGVAAFQLWVSPNNPPGFFRDEAAIAYNAHTIASEGRDEYGARVPFTSRRSSTIRARSSSTGSQESSA